MCVCNCTLLDHPKPHDMDLPAPLDCHRDVSPRPHTKAMGGSTNPMTGAHEGVAVAVSNTVSIIQCWDIRWNK